MINSKLVYKTSLSTIDTNLLKLENLFNLTNDH